MKSVTTLALAGAFCVLLFTFPLSAADKPAVPAGKTTPATVHPRAVWPPETLSGTITMVEPDQHLVVVQGSNGASFDMVVTPRTHINSGSQALTVKDLVRYEKKAVSIKFVPERRGDVAESIRING